MSTSAVSTGAVEAWTDSERLWVRLADGRILGVPFRMFPRLAHATGAERARIEIGPAGLGLSWPGLDEDISVAGLLEGRGDETTSAREHRESCATCGG